MIQITVRIGNCGGAMQKAVLLWLALVWVMGCGPGKLKLDGPASGNSDYADELDDWTRSRSLYDHFETRAVVYATFYSPRFIAAYLAEYERIYSPTDEEFQEVRLKIKERAARKDYRHLPPERVGVIFPSAAGVAQDHAAVGHVPGQLGAHLVAESERLVSGEQQRR